MHGLNERAAGKPAHPVPEAVRQLARLDILLCAAVAVAEGMLFLMVATDGLSLVSALVVHCAIALGLALVLDRREQQSQDARILAIATVTTAISGVLGASFSMLLALYLHVRQARTELLGAWYERISGHMAADPAALLHERIESGRTVDAGIRATANFSAILRSGPLLEKQHVLGVIAQKYHPSLAGLLQLALRNADAPIRVQAAAVVTRLRGEERRKLRESLAAGEAMLANTDGVPGPDLIEQHRQHLDSGLLDTQDRDAARAMLETLCRRRLATHPLDVAAALALGAVLVAEGRASDAAACLKPLVDAGIGPAATPYRDAMLSAGRYREAAALMHGSGPSPTLAAPH